MYAPIFYDPFEMSSERIIIKIKGNQRNKTRTMKI